MVTWFFPKDPIAPKIHTLYDHFGDFHLSYICYHGQHLQFSGACDPWPIGLVLLSPLYSLYELPDSSYPISLLFRVHFLTAPFSR